jgi:hypothetical protein
VANGLARGREVDLRADRTQVRSDSVLDDRRTIEEVVVVVGEATST